LNKFILSLFSARHRCSCIVLLEYKCPECQKKFNCPANLASHRRWHQPRSEIKTKSDGGEFNCGECGKSFKRLVYLRLVFQEIGLPAQIINYILLIYRKHQQTHKNDNQKQPKAKEAKPRTNSTKSSDTDSVQDQEPYIPETVFSFNRPSPAQLTEASSNASDADFHISHNFTEDESIAIRALECLRSGNSVIRHTMLTA
jgi:hypothetical protein